MRTRNPPAIDFDFDELADGLNDSCEHQPLSSYRGRAARPSPGSAPTAAPSMPSNNLTPPARASWAPRSGARDRPRRPCQSAACSAAPPSTSSVEMSHCSSCTQSCSQVADACDERGTGARQARDVGLPADCGRSCQYYHRPARRGSRTAAPRGRPQPPIEHHARQRPRAVAFADRQQRVVDEHRPGPDADGVDRGAQPLRPAIGLGRRELRALARRGGDPRVEAGRRLQDHERPALRLHDDKRAFSRAASASSSPLRPRCRARAAPRSPSRSPADSDRAWPRRRGECRRR